MNYPNQPDHPAYQKGDKVGLDSEAEMVEICCFDSLAFSVVFSSRSLRLRLFKAEGT
jgi:hypothetical protein